MATIAEQVAEKIAEIRLSRFIIRNTLTNWNVASSTDNLNTLAAKLSLIENRGTVNANVKEGETYTVEPGYYAGGTVAGVAGGGNYSLQEKTITPTKKATTVTSDAGYYGLSQVVVNAIPDAYQDISIVTAAAPDVLVGKTIVASDGTVKAGTMPNNGTLSQKLDANTTSATLSSGYYAGGTVSITTEEKSVTPTKSAQTVTPSSGKVLKKVSVGKIPDAYQNVTGVTATAPHVLDGDIFVDATGAQVEGTMANNGTIALSFDPLTQSSVDIPAGYTSGGTITLTEDLLNALSAI